MRSSSRLFCCLASLVLLLAAACGNREAGESGTPSPGAAASAGASGDAITIGYSDWPGWVAWDIAEQKGFFKKHGVDVKLVWFPVYTDSLNALSAGQLDANCQTWNDTLGPLAQGLPLKAVLVNDYSFGNDALIARPGFNSVAELRGKRVATELGTVDHFLLLKALEANGMKESDIQFVNIKVQDCPAAMLAGQVDAAVVWEPSRTKILNEVKGSKAVFDSADVPGQIPDLLVFGKKIVDGRPEDVQKIVLAWYEAVDWWRAHPDEAVAIMAKRTETPVADYQTFVRGTRIVSAAEALQAMTRSEDAASLYKTGESIAQFLVNAEQVARVPDFAAAIDDRFVRAAVEKGLGKQPPYDYGTQASAK